MKLLIAEDDALIRDALDDILSGEGYTCSLAEDGEQAWQQYQAEQPDIVLLDIMMPKVDGYSVCRNIRAENQHTAVMFISAKSEEIDRVLGLELGADDYIMKPFGKHEVIARVKAMARRYQLSQHQPSEQAQRFRMADLEIDPLALRAHRGEQQIELSIRDCKILSYLYQHANQVVSREALYNHAWGRNFVASSRTLDQHIAQLRKLIEVDAKEPVIVKTVHGVGYRYEG